MSPALEARHRDDGPDGCVNAVTSVHSARGERSTLLANSDPMGLRMHDYENGLTGLAAFCDTCGEQITEHGYVIWNSRNVADWRVIHQGRCDPGRRLDYDHSMPLDAEIGHLAFSTGIDPDSLRERVELFAQL